MKNRIIAYIISATLNLPIGVDDLIVDYCESHLKVAFFYLKNKLK